METSTVFKQTKICTRCVRTETQTQSERRPAASYSRTHSAHSSRQRSSSRLLLIAMTLLACMPLPEARHVHTVEDDYSVEAALPTWQANPYLGLGDSSSSNSDSVRSYDELLEDSSSNVGSSSVGGSKSAALEDLLYDEIAIATEALRKLHHRRSLLRRRRRHLSDIFKRSESETAPAWVNPCNGGYDPTDETVFSLRQSLKKLRIVTHTEYKKVKFYKDPVIDTTDLPKWKWNREDYKFLPFIRKSSNVCLQRWYGDIQTYIGSFEELGRAQYKADKQEQNESNSHELLSLLQSARNLLCEIEIGINTSYSSHDRIEKLHVPTREEMRARLNFKTNFANGDAPDILDLKFAKAYYLQYMSKMFSVIKESAKGRNINDCAAVAATASSSTSSSSSAMAAVLGTSSESNASDMKSIGVSSASASAEHKASKMRRRKRVNARQN